MFARTLFSVIAFMAQLSSTRGHSFEISAIQIENGNEEDQIGTVLHTYENKLIIGSPSSRNMLGRVLVYERKNHDSDYFLSGEFYGRSANEHFGASVTMMGDSLIVGSPFRTCYSNNMPLRKCGGVHVFRNTQGKNISSLEWASHTIESDISNAFNLFGSSLAAGRTVIAVGSPGYNGYLGHVGIFRLNFETDSWYKIADVSPKTNVFYGKFGISIAMTGNFLAVGSSGDTSDGLSGGGSVHMYYSDDTEMSWQLQAYLVPSNPVEGGAFGGSLAMYGNRLVVGAQQSAGHTDYTGAAYLFENAGGTQNDEWTEIEILIAHDGESGDRFGCSVAMYGETIAVGACNEDGKMVQGLAWQASDGQNCGDYSSDCTQYEGKVQERGEAAGAVYLYSYEIVTNEGYEKWQEIRKVLPDKSASEWYFGSAVSVNGDTVIVSAPGAPSADETITQVGRVYELKVDWIYFKNGISNMHSVIMSIVVVALILAVPISIYIICMIRGSTDLFDCWSETVSTVSNKLTPVPQPHKDVSIRSTHGLLEEGSVRSSASHSEIELPASRTGPGEDKQIADWGISRPSRKKPLPR